MHIYGFLVCRKCCVKVGFLDIGAEAIDSFEGGGCVDGERIRSDANDWAIFEMCAVVTEMTRATVSVVSKVDISDFRERRAGISCQRMER